MINRNTLGLESMINFERAIVRSIKVMTTPLGLLSHSQKFLPTSWKPLIQNEVMLDVLFRCRNSEG